MEGNDSPELSGWLRAQGACARRFLDRIAGRERLFKRMQGLGLATSAAHEMRVAGGRAFFHEMEAGAQLAKLVVREADGRQRGLVDPIKRGDGKQHASVNAFAPSPDGKLVAYDLALGGGEVSTLHVMDVDTGNDLPDVIERIWGELSVSWMPDGKSFFYTQMAPAKPEADPLQNMQARHHVLGQSVSSDVPMFGNGAPASLAVAPEEFPFVRVWSGTPWAVAILGGAQSELRVAVARLADLDRSGRGTTPWREVAAYSYCSGKCVRWPDVARVASS
jgi:prolyl oligopeptidase